ncbi:GNAT family N-acetyltransferase [Paenibacillus sp. DLE-14]|uniref:GNAT family N-acetyltransferase n=1 Tax=Paenibacillus lignilyticus TaxID=1172615 RepID=A0ABS5CLW7_9BACL|nr:GNAT family N-acetyltransferase [Paenibacillus lignilyticus]
MSEGIPDINLFMMCTELNPSAVRSLPTGFRIRKCREAELGIWMDFPFDNAGEAEKYRGFMSSFFQDVYSDKKEVFFDRCLFVCDTQDRPIATCFAWKAYEKITTIHWFKVLKQYEGFGIGRALLSYVMQSLSMSEFPVFLHTQPSSYRAIKLYADFGFELLSDPVIGTRRNDLERCLPILQGIMPTDAFQALKITKAPRFFLEAVNSSSIEQF